LSEGCNRNGNWSGVYATQDAHHSTLGVSQAAHSPIKMVLLAVVKGARWSLVPKKRKAGLLFAKMCHFFFGVYLLIIVNMDESGSTPAGLTSTTMVGRELPSFELLSTASLLEGGCFLPHWPFARHCSTEMPPNSPYHSNNI